MVLAINCPTTETKKQIVSILVRRFITRLFSANVGYSLLQRRHYKNSTRQCKLCFLSSPCPGLVLTASSEWDGVVLKLRFKQKAGVATRTPLEKIVTWLRELMKLRDVFSSDPATAQLSAA